MSVADFSDIGRGFLMQVDDHLRANLKALTCHDLWTMYSDFFSLLKTFKGNANGFTGLSEYLLFRHVYHLLGGSFARTAVPGSRDLWQFVSKADPDLVIGQSIRVTVDGKGYYPDIVVYAAGELLAVCSIKLYLSGGWNTVRSELAKLKDIRSLHGEMRALLVIFGSLSERGTIYPRLRQAAEDHDWFDFLILQENTQPLHKAIYEGLALGRVAHIDRGHNT